MQVFLLLALVAGLLFMPCNASAIMPPLLDGSVPESGGVLEADVIQLQGYTLFRPEPGQLELIDMSSGEPAPWEVAELTCVDEGDRERAEIEDGAIQFRCTLLIRLLEPIPEHEYSLRFLDWTIDLTYRPSP